MAKFRYYIVAMYDGMVNGTDDALTADECRDSEGHYVINAETGKWLQDSKEVDIEEMKSV